MAKEDIAVLVVTTPISSAAIYGLTNFTAWMVQHPDESFQSHFISNHLCNIYFPPLHPQPYHFYTPNF